MYSKYHFSYLTLPLFAATAAATVAVALSFSVVVPKSKSVHECSYGFCDTINGNRAFCRFAVSMLQTIFDSCEEGKKLQIARVNKKNLGKH